MFGLEGKVILVTGGSRGIGESIVAKLEELGAIVAYTSRTSKGRFGHLFIKADASKADEMKQVVLTVQEKLGPIYGVVSNAGINRDAFFHKMSEESWGEVIDINLNGAFHTLRHILPQCYEQQSGSVVLISSIVASIGNLGQVNYAASKAGLIGLAKSLAKESARKGVRVNVVAPGFTLTEMTEGIPEKVKEKFTSQIPMGRFAKPEEISWSVAFLLSPTLSSYITGQVLDVNGGQYM